MIKTSMILFLAATITQARLFPSFRVLMQGESQKVAGAESVEVGSPKFWEEFAPLLAFPAGKRLNLRESITTGKPGIGYHFWVFFEFKDSPTPPEENEALHKQKDVETFKKQFMDAHLTFRRYDSESAPKVDLVELLREAQAFFRFQDFQKAVYLEERVWNVYDRHRFSDGPIEAVAVLKSPLRNQESTLTINFEARHRGITNHISNWDLKFKIRKSAPAAKLPKPIKILKPQPGQVVNLPDPQPIVSGQFPITAQKLFYIIEHFNKMQVPYQYCRDMAAKISNTSSQEILEDITLEVQRPSRSQPPVPVQGP